MTFAVLRKAEAQALKAARWYDKKNPGKGTDFLLELDKVYQLIQQRPSLHPRVPARGRPDTYRVHVMKRFMYNVCFRVRIDGILVVAVVHQSRRSSHWTRNLP